MAIDPQRLDEIIAEFARQHEALRARLPAVTTMQEFVTLVKAEFSTTTPDAERVQVFVANRIKAGKGALPIPLPPAGPLTEEEMAVVRARLPELEALVSGWRKMVSDTAQRLLRPSAAPRTTHHAAIPAAPDTAGAPAEAGAAATVRPKDPEALAWLRQNPGEAPLAANRFDAARAREFVESLYRAGARSVVIASECIRDDEDPPYADGMRVVLPPEPDRRGAVLDLVNHELAEEGFDPEPDRNQEVVFLWWD